MGILDDFIKTIKSQRERYKSEQERAEAEKKARQGKPSDYGYVGEVAERIKEQRKGFEEAQKTARPAGKAVQEQKAPEAVELFGHSFKREAVLSQHILVDDPGKAVYIDDPDAYLKSGGKVEVKGISAAMDPYMYDIYTSKGGPMGQARYYRKDNVVVSLVPNPFT